MENGTAVKARTLYHTVVLVLVVFALVVIWRHEWFHPENRVLTDAIGYILSIIVIVPAAFVLISALCPTRQITEAAARDATEYQADYSTIPNPYPAKYKSKTITRFRHDGPLHLMRLKERLLGISPEQQYIVAEEYTVYYTLDGKDMPITVPRGMLTDLASVPPLLRWYIGRVGPHLEASIIHDYLYIAWQLNTSSKSDEWTRQMRCFADDLMLVAMKKAGMGCKALFIHRAIRLFGKRAFSNPNPDPLVLDLNKVPSQNSIVKRKLN